MFSIPYPDRLSQKTYRSYNHPLDFHWHHHNLHSIALFHLNNNYNNSVLLVGQHNPYNHGITSPQCRRIPSCICTHMLLFKLLVHEWQDNSYTLLTIWNSYIIRMWNDIPHRLMMATLQNIRVSIHMLARICSTIVNDLDSKSSMCLDHYRFNIRDCILMNKHNNIL